MLFSLNHFDDGKFIVHAKHNLLTEILLILLEDAGKAVLFRRSGPDVGLTLWLHGIGLHALTIILFA